MYQNGTSGHWVMTYISLLCKCTNPVCVSSVLNLDAAAVNLAGLLLLAEVMVHVIMSNQTVYYFVTYCAREQNPK